MPRAVHGGHGADEQRLGHEVAIARGIDAVGRDGGEAERFAEQFTRHGERAAGDGARAERQHGGAARGIGEPRAIAIERPEVREQPVGAAHRLRALEVRVRRQHRVGQCVSACVSSDCCRSRMAASIAPAGIHRPQPRGGRDLVVARATGVQLRGHRPGLLVQQPVDHRVDVLVGGDRLGAIGEPVRRRGRVPAAAPRLPSMVSTPACPSASAHALESRTSCGQRRKSVPMERLIASSSGDGPPAKRPPQSLCVGACVVLSVVVTKGSRGRAG